MVIFQFDDRHERHVKSECFSKGRQRQVSFTAEIKCVCVCVFPNLVYGSYFYFLIIQEMMDNLCPNFVNSNASSGGSIDWRDQKWAVFSVIGLDR